MVKFRLKMGTLENKRTFETKDPHKNVKLCRLCKQRVESKERKNTL